MVVFIDAYEHIYEGLHGMRTCGVFDFDYVGEAEEMAIDLSMSVIESYSCIIESFENPEDKYEVFEDIAFRIYEVTDKTLDKFTLDELNDAAAEIDEEEFIELYCYSAPISVC